MTSHVSKTFRKLLNDLPADVQRQARAAFVRWKVDHYYPSLRFRQVHPTEPFFSARVGIGWRALGYVENDSITWFWIGPHSEYDNLLKRL